jgi:hypothetical protein
MTLGPGLRRDDEKRKGLNAQSARSRGLFVHFAAFSGGSSKSGGAGSPAAQAKQANAYIASGVGGLV